MKKNITKLICFASISALLLSCQSSINKTNTLIPLQNVSTLSKDDDGSNLFVNNGIAKPETQKFLTSTSNPDEHPIWSPDGKHISFQRATEKGFNIWVMNPDGSNQKQITFCDFDCQQSTWTPDSKYIGFRKAMGEVDANGKRNFDIAKVELATGKESPVITYPGDDKHPNFSKDGKYLVFNSERDGLKANIYIVPTSNTKAKPTRITQSTDTNDVHPNFSEDGRYILFHSYILNAPASADSEDVPSKLGIVNSDGKNLKWINTGSLLFPKHPFFTPDENIITFHATDPKTEKRNIYATNLKNNKIVQITEIKNAKHPEISPDGKSLVYAHKRKDAKGEKQYDISLVQINFEKLIKAIN